MEMAQIYRDAPAPDRWKCACVTAERNRHQRPFFLLRLDIGWMGKIKAPRKSSSVPVLFGAGERNRTPDPLITNQ